MRKSQVVTLALLGTAAVAATVYNLSESDEAHLFRSPADCVAAFSKEACETNFADAKKEHEQTAPKFTRKEQCEQEFGVGNCEQREVASGSGVSSMFLPLMMGYMMGRSGGIAPVYRDRADNLTTGGRNGGQTVGRYDAGRQTATLNDDVRRGGFGRSATAHGSSGIS
jgi:uncharacterized protein YgiB involved in biofilm formation